MNAEADTTWKQLESVSPTGRNRKLSRRSRDPNAEASGLQSYVTRALRSNIKSIRKGLLWPQIQLQVGFRHKGAIS